MNSHKVPRGSHVICMLAVHFTLVIQVAVTTSIPSHRGTDFFVAFSKNPWQSESLQLFVSTLTSETVNFLASSTSQSFSFLGSVRNGSATEVPVPASLELQAQEDRQKGIWIRPVNNQAKLSIVVFKSANLVSGGYLALPPHTYTGVQQYTYYGVSYPNDGRLTWDVKSGMLLVASNDNTRVTITPSQTVDIPVDLRDPINYRTAINSGESYTITMQNLQTFAFESSEDLTGTRVASNKPVTVISSHECADVPSSVAFCDHIVEQVPPTLTWGRFFLVTSLHTRRAGEHYKAVALKPSTSLIVRCVRSGDISPESNTTSLNFTVAGQSKEFAIWPNRYCSVQATGPVMIMQFSSGYSLDQIGDPFMLYVPPVEQFTHNVSVYAPSGFHNHISIVVPEQYFDPTQIFVRGVLIPRTNWSPIYCSQSQVCGYGAVLGVSIGVSYVYHSDSNARIGVFAYGFEFHTAYGYPAGMELNQIADVCLHGDTRLVPPSPSLTSQTLGRVEVCVRGAWSSVCGTGWDVADASVLCQQLGYSSRDVAAFTGSSNTNTFPFLFTNAQCSGTESRLSQCTHTSTLSQCTSGRVAFAQCQPLPAPSVSTAIVGDIHLGNPITITCSVQFTFELWNGMEVQVSWRKDSRSLQNSTHLQMTDAVHTNGTSAYQSNFSMSSAGERDNGVYTCTARAFLPLLSSHQITSTGYGATFLSLQSIANQLIQLRLIGVGDCSEWLYGISLPIEKASRLTEIVIDRVNALCPSENCGLTSNHFTESAFQCFSQNAHEVTFRTRLHETSEASIVELIDAILEWVDSGAVVSVGGVLLTVDPNCATTIESVSEGECVEVTQPPLTTVVTSDETTTTTPTTLTTTQGLVTTALSQVTTHLTTHGHMVTSIPTLDTVGGAEGQSQQINLVAIVAGVVALLALLICAILIGVIVIACLCVSRKSRQSHEFPRGIAVSAVSPFPPPAYTMGGDHTHTAGDEVKVPPDYAELEEYWNNNAEHKNSTV